VANTKSAIKRMRQTERRRVRNRMIRSKVRTAVKVARAADAGTSRAAILEAIRELDKAVSKGVIHRNKAARHKNRLSARIQALG